MKTAGKKILHKNALMTMTEKNVVKCHQGNKHLIFCSINILIILSLSGEKLEVCVCVFCLPVLCIPSRWGTLANPTVGGRGLHCGIASIKVSQKPRHY